jgi:hypothetical protein
MDWEPEVEGGKEERREEEGAVDDGGTLPKAVDGAGREDTPTADGCSSAAAAAAAATAAVVDANKWDR